MSSHPSVAIDKGNIVCRVAARVAAAEKRAFDKSVE